MSEADRFAFVRPSIDKVIDWSKSKHGRRLFRYTLVSVISTVTSIIVIAIVYGLRIISGEVEATIFGNVVATLPAYNLNRRWTWGKTGRSHVRKEIIPFWVMAALGIVFSIIGASYAHHLVHTHHWSHLINTGLVVGANFVSFAIFWFLKLVVFNRIFQVEETV